jgi:phospholipid/cholesterol/gamma-HCH transport system substrate-binding protein
MGVKVGSIDSIEPAGDRMKINFHYDSQYKVPANATASVLNPTIVASRSLQLDPPYTGGDVLADNAVIPMERTRTPVEWDDIRGQLDKLVKELGPQGKPGDRGALGGFVDSLADTLSGNGKDINSTFRALSDAVATLNESRGDLFATTRALAVFVNALHQSDQQFVALNTNLATFTGSLTNSDQEVARALQEIDSLLKTARKFVDDNGSLLSRDINNLADVTNSLMQPDARNGIETALHVYPTLVANTSNIYHPTHGAIVAIPAVANWANPMQFLCSAIQSGSRLGYQDSAELCAEYLAPILDATKFNAPPFGLNQFSPAETLPKYVAYSEDRLRPPSGYKDTTVPGVWSRDTLFSHGNSSTVPWQGPLGEPDWIVAPGMQGVEVGPLTGPMLTPDSLAALMGGPDPVSVPPAGPRGGAPSNSYDQNNPLPPPWYPGAPPPPAPGVDVVPGPLPVSQQTGPPPAAPAPAAPGPMLPAEMGAG